MTRHRRLRHKIRKSPQRMSRKWRCRGGRRIRRSLAEMVRVLKANTS